MPNYKVAVTLCLLLLLMVAVNESVSAQSEERKFEVGAQISGLAGGSFGDRESLGGGGRLTYNFTKYFALEGELNYFTAARSGDFRRIQGQFGVKSGLRFNRFGIFGKLRPGFINTNEDFTVFFPIPCVNPPGPACIQSFVPISGSNSDTAFSLDVGAVTEFYPSKRVLVRLDVGNAIQSHREPTFIVIPPSLSGQTVLGFGSGGFIALPEGRSATSNLQLSLGVGFRF